MSEFSDRFKAIESTNAYATFKSKEGPIRSMQLESSGEKGMRDVLVAIYMEVAAWMNEGLKAGQGNIDALLKAAEKEKKFEKEAFSDQRYGSMSKLAWAEFRSQAKSKGLFPKYAFKEAKEIMSKNQNAVFSLADTESADLTQRSCPKWPKSKLENSVDTEPQHADAIITYAKENIQERVKSHFTSLFKDKFTLAPVKDFGRVVEKISQGKKPYTILDYVRGTYIVDTPEELATFISNIKKNEFKGVTFKRLKNGFKALAEGKPTGDDYPRILLNLMVFDEFIIEVQVTLAKIKKVAKVDHIFYEMDRRPQAQHLLG